jgi:putative oxidoreductase
VILFKTNKNAMDALLLFLRLALGVVMFAHGAQKVLGWFGGYGFAASMQAFTGMMHIPPFFALLAILAEFVGSILLISGALARLSALAISVNMLVAIAMVHFANGFFMNWTGQQKGEGFEYHILAIAIGATLVIAGAGRYSIDALVLRNRERRAAGSGEPRLAA